MLEFNNVFDRNPEIVELLIYHSRFEFALKCNGWTKKSGVDDTISADWDLFWKHYNIQLLNSSVAEKSLEYFKCHPPKIMSAKTGSWELPSFHFKDNSDDKKLYLYINTVRNNLFHGEKFDLISDDTTLERNLLLINHSLLVLKTWTKLPGLNGLF